MSASLRNLGELRIQIYDTNSKAKIISHKMYLARVLFPLVEVNEYRSCVEELPMEVNGVESKEWEKQYPQFIQRN